MATKTKPEQSLKLAWVDPNELEENPKNWRTHSDSQMSSLGEVISQVGWAGVILKNETTGKIIDGHARRRLAIEKGIKKVPVLLGNWTEEQEKIILATLDPLGELSGTDTEALSKLLEELGDQSPAMNDLLQSIAENTGILLAETVKQLEQDRALENQEALLEDLPGAEDPGLPPSHVRMVQLFFDTNTFPIFLSLWHSMADIYGTTNATETVLECLKRANDQAKLAAQ